MNRKNHWERVYSGKPSAELGWYQPRLQTSMAWIEDLSSGADTPIIDVGGGASTLVDSLSDAGFRSVTVLDISENALSSARARLTNNADMVEWLNADITEADLPRHQYQVWHDRAAFHFLTKAGQQRKYRNRLLQALKPDGHLIIGTFALEAPPTCSGLPVQRYNPGQLSDAIGEAFELVRHQKEQHFTPRGIKQTYLYCHFHRKA
jgi:2-polyprenyl-3-methyl-5-hydroxy-6-metoxy-1,4-benzoquinol methylase